MVEMTQACSESLCNPPRDLTHSVSVNMLLRHDASLSVPEIMPRVADGGGQMQTQMEALFDLLPKSRHHRATRGKKAETTPFGPDRGLCLSVCPPNH